MSFNRTIRKLLHKDNPAGVSLVELMIAAGLVAVLSLAIAQLMSMMSSGQRKIWQSLYTQELNAAVYSAVGTKLGCKNSLGGMSFQSAPLPVTAIRDGANPPANGNLVIDASGAGGTFPKNAGPAGGALQKIQFSVSAVGAITPNQINRGILRMTFERLAPNSNTDTILPVTKDFYLIVVPAGAGPYTINECYSSLQDSACVTMGGQMNPATGQCVLNSFCIGSAPPKCVTTFWNGQTCPNGQALYGFGPLGGLMCATR